MSDTASPIVPGFIPTRHPLLQGLDAAKANLAPGAVLWIIGLAILLGYYYHRPTNDLLNAIATLKLEVGFPFAMASTMIFGGLLPVLAQRLAPGSIGRAPMRHAPFLIVFWALKGFEIDLFYRLQAAAFGDDVSLAAVLPKILVDQLLYVPLWGAPTIIFAYLWKDCGYRFSETRRRLGPQWYRRRALPMLLANWAVWIPAVGIIYCLPLALQLPIQNIVLCLWVLMAMFLTREH